MVRYAESKVKKLSRHIQEFMRHRFNLPVEYLGILRCLEITKQVNGNKSTSLNIFSPVRAKEYHIKIKTFTDLERYPEMVLFKGHIDSDGVISVTDRRGPAWKYR